MVQMFPCCSGHLDTAGCGSPSPEYPSAPSPPHLHITELLSSSYIHVNIQLLGQKLCFHFPLNNSLLLDGFSLSLGVFFSLPGWVFPSPKVAFSLCPQRTLSLAPLPSGVREALSLQGASASSLFLPRAGCPGWPSFHESPANPSFLLRALAPEP